MSRKAAPSKTMTSRVVATGSPLEGGRVMTDVGFGAIQKMAVVPSTGQGPQGTCAVMVPFGAAPAVPPPPVGAGKGFTGI